MIFQIREDLHFPCKIGQHSLLIPHCLVNLEKLHANMQA
jgi:hypothetical protein